MKGIPQHIRQILMPFQCTTPRRLLEVASNINFSPEGTDSSLSGPLLSEIQQLRTQLSSLSLTKPSTQSVVNAIAPNNPPNLTPFTTSQGHFPLAHVKGPHQVVSHPLVPPPMVPTAQPFVQPGVEMIPHNVCRAVPADQPPVQQLNAFQGYPYGMPFPNHVSTPNFSQSAPQQGFYQQSVRYQPPYNAWFNRGQNAQNRGRPNRGGWSRGARGRNSQGRTSNRTPVVPSGPPQGHTQNNS